MVYQFRQNSKKMKKNREKHENDLIQMVKVHPNSVVVYKTNPNCSPGRKASCPVFDENFNEIKANQKQPSKNQHNGFLSDKAGARLRTAIKYLFWLSDCIRLVGKKYVLSPAGKISFLTLTLSYVQQHDDVYIKKKMINQFITELTSRYPKMIYIWRAEKQRNGAIHFHFLLNIFVPHQIIREIWNRIQAKEGYIQAYHDKFCNLDFWNYLRINSYTDSTKLDQYRKQYNYGQSTNWMNPNSTDIQSLKKIKNVYAYISKYISKNLKSSENCTEAEIEEYKIEGRIYYCSTKISKIKQIPKELTSDEISELDKLHTIVPDKFFICDFYTLISISPEFLYNFKCFKLFSIFVNSIKPIYPSLFNTT